MRDESVPEGSEAGNEPSERADVARISRDMESIFGTAAVARPAKLKVGPDPVEALVVPRPKRARKPAVGPPAFLALGALIGGGLAWLAVPSSHIAPVRRAVPSQWARPVEPLPLIPSTPPQQVEQARTAPSPPVSIVPGSAAYAGADAVAGEGPIAVRKRPTLARAAFHPVVDPSPRRKRLTVSVADTSEPCADMQGLWRARCMRPQILAADRRLRDAYDGAVRAGVDRRMLVAYRNRWSRLRDDAVSDPSHVAVTFQQMAQSLDAARAEAAEF